MKKIVPILLLAVCSLVILSGCSGKKTIHVEVDTDELASLAISGYPIIFANGDSIDTTTDITRITKIASAFSDADFELYKSKEDWAKIKAAPTGKDKATITFFDGEKKTVGSFTRVTNADGSFIIKVQDDNIYVAAKENYDELNSIYNALLDEAKEGRLNN